MISRNGGASLRAAPRTAKAASAKRTLESTNTGRWAYGVGMTAAHKISIAPFGGRVRVRIGGDVVADTAHALLLEEGPLPPAFYVPRGDVHMERFQPSPTASHCPFKGDASYFSMAGGPADVAWSYEAPLAQVSAIAGHLAFYPDKAEVETLPFG